MFTITDTLEAIQRAERIVASNRLLDDEKLALLEALQTAFAISIPSIPAHVNVAHTVITRMIENERTDARGTVGKPAKARKAQGGKNPASVDAGSPEEGAETPERTTEGVADQAQDA